MLDTTHTVKVNDVIYEYPCITSATNKNNRYISIRRTYGSKRTKEEAMALVEAWEQEHFKRNRKTQ